MLACVKAKLKVIVKRTLRQFGYPPDMQSLATETVLKQAEMIANKLTDHKQGVSQPHQLGLATPLRSIASRLCRTLRI